VQITATPVEGARAAAPSAVSLLASAPPGPLEPGWAGGIAWRSETCPTWQGFNPCAELDEGPEPGGDSIEYNRPVAYRVEDTCSTRSGGPDRDRLTRKASAIASFVVARELWTGALSDLDKYAVIDPATGSWTDDTYANGRLASATADELTAESDILGALAELEQATREATAGQQVFLHVPIRLANRVAQNLRRIGNELRTATDAIVVADAGYPGTGPAGIGTTWMYGTGPVVVRLGEIDVIDTPASTVDRRANSQTFWASRLFAATFDPCAHFAIQVTEQ
jgi:hypothetical protein